MVVKQLGNELESGIYVRDPGGVACSGGAALEGGDGAEGKPTNECVIRYIESLRIRIRTAVTNFGSHYVHGDRQVKARSLVIQTGTDFLLPRSYLAAVVIATGLGAHCGRRFLHHGPQTMQIVEGRVDDDLPYPVVRASIESEVVVTTAGGRGVAGSSNHGRDHH